MENNREYHLDDSHVSNTSLKMYRKSPRLYKQFYIDKTIPHEPSTNEQIIGSLTHLFVSGEPLESEFIVADGCKIRSGKLWDGYEQEAELKGLTPVLPTQLDFAKAMAEEVLKNPFAKKYWKCDGPVEQPYRFDGPYNIKCKIKPDKLIIDPYFDYPLCIDLKTSIGADPESFPRQAWTYEYHVQAAFYLNGLKANRITNAQFLFVVVSKEPPHDVFIYVADEYFIRHGNTVFHESLARLKNSIENDDWLAPGQAVVNTLSIPYWVKE